MKKIVALSLVSIVIFLVVGFAVPVDSFTTPGCPAKSPPTVRVNWIFEGGLQQKYKAEQERLEKLKSSGLQLGCPLQQKYQLYIL